MEPQAAKTLIVGKAVNLASARGFNAKPDWVDIMTEPER
jgi:hypothetical protein